MQPTRCNHLLPLSMSQINCCQAELVEALLSIALMLSLCNDADQPFDELRVTREVVQHSTFNKQRTFIAHISWKNQCLTQTQGTAPSPQGEGDGG